MLREQHLGLMYILLPLSTAGLITPIALTFEASRGRLYIGEDSGQQRVLVFGDIW